MKLKAHIITMMVSMLIFMPTICFSKTKSDSVLLNKIWSYKRNYAYQHESGSLNTYLRYTVETKRRNFTMFLVPTLYAVAKDQRLFISEIYGKTEFNANDDVIIRPQVISNTIPHDRQLSEAFSSYLTPTLYDNTLYKEKLLSPFHRRNRNYYHYETENMGNNMAKVSFRPRLKNTQLVTGYALVDPNTGRIIYTAYDGQFDMLDFHIDVTMGTDEFNSIYPQRCKTDMKFNFMGNKLDAHYLSTFNAPTTLPDSLRGIEDRKKMDTLRTVQLREDELDIYRKYDHEEEMARLEREQREAQIDTLQRRKRTLGDVLWDIGDRLVSSSHTEAFGANFSLSPIINPQYLSYSRSRGISYKLQLGLRYNWNSHRYLSIEPQIGYNFKQKQFYHYTPVRMTYNPKRNGYAEIVFANGNRISNSSILEVLKEKFPNDSIKEYQNMQLDYFTDHYIQAANNVVAYDWLEIKSGLVFHLRKAVNKSGMRAFDLPMEYRSFAPTLTLRITPWKRGPLFTINWEQSIKGILGSNLAYGRYEFDASHKFRLPSLRLINVRGGFGFYSHHDTSFFLDYTNFRDRYIPGGPEDDWTCNFQLLNSQWYNQSNYYARLHASYESPLLFLSFVPIIGKQIEVERFYLNLLSIQHTRMYSELGYGFSTRFFSLGAFGNFLNTKFQKFEIKFTFELFRKW